MAKADFGSAKYQAKQLKASGLQKLRYYCQLCAKQCRDANGFKNHLGLPSHMGRISNISDSGVSSEVIYTFLAQFELDFLRLLRINHGTKKINANKYYQEYILNDKDHVHMNATRWTSLTSFVKHLGRSGKVRVEIPADNDDEFNLFILLVDVASEAQLERKKRTVQTEEERELKFLDAQIDRGKELYRKSGENLTEAGLEGGGEPAPKNPPVAISLRGLGSKKGSGKGQKKSAFGDLSDDEG